MSIKIIPVIWQTKKCIGITQKGTPCNNKRTMVRNCDDQGVCKKHLSQLSNFNPRLNNPNELPKNILNLLPFELWLDILELIPQKPCKNLSMLIKKESGMGCRTDGKLSCSSCGKIYKKRK
jgi:hypothetical protein